jgi:hypothetical protein
MKPTQPKRGMVFPIDYATIHQLVAEDLKDLSFWKSVAVDYLNPKSTTKMPTEGWTIAEITPNKKLTLFSVPAGLDVPGLVEGLRLAFRAVASTTPPAFSEATSHRRHSIVVRYKPSEELRCFHRTVSYKQVKYRATDKFTNIHPKVQSIVEKRI